jgi:uncharacterized SAM-binding protein YcdF (DUF218 family)
VAQRRFRYLKLSLALAVLVALAILAHSLWLPWFGYALVHEDGPGKAEIAVVLAGDFYGNRILKAGELVRAGYVPAALISGPAGMYGVNECDLAIPFAVSHGYPAEYFIPFHNRALSTREEAHDVLAELRRRNIRSFLLLTSDYHTARSRRIYLATERELGGGPDFRTVSAPDEYFRADSWWHTRESQKIVFFEWSKTFATAAGM